jgi:hypothetical protein
LWYNFGAPTVAKKQRSLEATVSPTSQILAGQSIGVSPY